MAKNNIATDDVNELGAVLDVVGEKLPNIINGLMKNLYSEEAGRQIGRAVGGMYQELVASGMDKADVMHLVQDYMSTLKGMMSNVKVNS